MRKRGLIIGRKRVKAFRKKKKEENEKRQEKATAQKVRQDIYNAHKPFRENTKAALRTYRDHLGNKRRR